MAPHTRLDTAFDPAIDDERLIRRACEEGRHLLTRYRKLFSEWHIEGGLLVDSDLTSQQVAQVVDAFRLPRPRRLFTRCRVCNQLLEPTQADEVAARIPDRVRARTGTFTRCRGCGRVYWEGTHTERMRHVLDDIFGAPAHPPHR